MRKWRPPTVNADNMWSIKYQIVVPPRYRSHILHLGHTNPMAGHLGVRKSYHRVMQHFFWPGLKRSVQQHCRSCSVCQIVGKPNQLPPKAPLKPISAFNEPFSHLLNDCVGPLPKRVLANNICLQ